MTIDEKLQHFYEVSLDEAREDAAKAIQDHKAYLEQVLEEHKQSRTQTAEAEVKAEAEHVRREVNKALSAEQITLKRDWSLRMNSKNHFLLKSETKPSGLLPPRNTAIISAAASKKQKISQKMTRSRSIFLPGTKNLQMHSVQRQAVHSSFLPKIFSEGSARRFRAKTS